MPQFVVLCPSELPSPGSLTNGAMYRGDHVDEVAAVKAAAAILNPRAGTPMWVTTTTSFTRYTLTGTRDFSAVVG